MRRLFLVDGEPGTGKTTLWRYVAQHPVSRCTALPYLTTRPSRWYEEDGPTVADSISLSGQDFDQLGPEYQYECAGEKYGFTKGSLDSALRASPRVFVVVRDLTTMSQLDRDYPNVDVVPIFITAEDTVREARLLEAGMSVAAATSRLRRDTRAARDHRLHPDIYRHCISNDSTLGSLKSKIDALIGVSWQGDRVGQAQ